MTTPNLTPAPAAPQRSDPSTFASRGDAFLTWLVNVIVELNAFVIWVQGVADLITSSSNYWTNANAVSASDINCAIGVYFKKTVTTATTFSFTNPPASDKAYSMTLKISHTSGAITWPSSVVWAEGVPPTLMAGKVHMFVFVTDDSGAVWHGSVLPNFSA